MNDEEDKVEEEQSPLRYAVYRLNTTNPNRGQRAGSPSSKVFYSDYEEALDWAKDCTRKSGKPCVVMATVAVVEPIKSPVVVTEYSHLHVGE